MLHLGKDCLGLKKHHHPIDLLAELNALFSGISLFPQLFKVLETHHLSDLAPSSFLIVFITNIIWHAYGWHRKNLPTLVASVLMIISSGFILGLILFWK
ncbi:hypothetical protein EXS71_01785 [Candidatus Uhrbacteria bacterium]|nr:hypothetical protein [Candidatus Uhrbacteria bacterium]